MKKIFGTLIVAFAFILVAGSVHAANDNTPATNTCMGTERALLNSNGGSREKGYFGSIQAPWVKNHSPYGQWLQEWKEAHCESNSVR